MEPTGTLYIDLLTGKDIKAVESQPACLYVKIKVGSDTSWTDQPARDYQEPVFGKKFTGFNVRLSVIIEFQVINKTRTSDTIVGKGKYAVNLLSSNEEVIYVPLKPSGFLKVEMRYERNKVYNVRQQPQLGMCDAQARGPARIPGMGMNRQMMCPAPAPTPSAYPVYGMRGMGPIQQQQQQQVRPIAPMPIPVSMPMSMSTMPMYIPMQPQQQGRPNFPSYYPVNGYQDHQRQPPQIPPMPPTFANPYPMYQGPLPNIQYPSFTQ